MNIARIVMSTIIDAIFPLSKVEEELLALSPADAYVQLPPAPIPPVPNVHSIFFYADERVSKLVWQIKYMKSDKAISMGGYALSRKLAEIFPSGKILLIPIPITKKRRRERGFNQCELLLEAMKQLDSAGRFLICNDLLIRTQHLSRQTLKGRDDRLQSAQGIFAVNEIAAKNVPNDSTIVVIDDVITTGSTMKEAVGTLNQFGFQKVHGLSLAH